MKDNIKEMLKAVDLSLGRIIDETHHTEFSGSYTAHYTHPLLDELNEDRNENIAYTIYGSNVSWGQDGARLSRSGTYWGWSSGNSFNSSSSSPEEALANLLSTREYFKSQNDDENHV